MGHSNARSCCSRSGLSAPFWCGGVCGAVWHRCLQAAARALLLRASTREPPALRQAEGLCLHREFQVRPISRPSCVCIRGARSACPRQSTSTSRAQLYLGGSGGDRQAPPECGRRAVGRCVALAQGEGSCMHPPLRSRSCGGLSAHAVQLPTRTHLRAASDPREVGGGGGERRARPGPGVPRVRRLRPEGRHGA